jgi:excisionase family DNA binding protein
MENSILIENIGTREDLKTIIKEAIGDYFGDEKPKQDKFLSRAQVKEMLGICYPTLDKALNEGELIGYRIGGRILIKESELALSKFGRRHYKPRR